MLFPPKCKTKNTAGTRGIETLGRPIHASLFVMYKTKESTTTGTLAREVDKRVR